MEINDNRSYKKALHQVYSLINKGEKNITKAEEEVIKTLSVAIEWYEDHVLKIVPLPVTVTSIVQEKIAALNISQTQLAQMFGIGKAKLSQILNGRRPVDVPFLKAIHEKLGIDGNFILEAV